MIIYKNKKSGIQLTYNGYRYLEEEIQKEKNNIIIKLSLIIAILNLVLLFLRS